MKKFLTLFSLFNLLSLGALEVIPERYYYSAGETAVFKISIGRQKGARMIDVKIHGNREVARELRMKTDSAVMWLN